MPRKFREKSFTNTYHCIIRGINKQNLFFDQQDKDKFLNELKKTKDKYNYSLYAYCIMSNHVHLLIKDNNNKLQSIMQSITISYSIYFNKKYDRSGHLFENRYKSSSIESKSYILNLHRYIHRNPVKANICRTECYPYSSFNDYIYQKGVSDTDFILSLFHSNKKTAIKLFRDFNLFDSSKYDNIKILEYEIAKRVDDKEATDLIKSILNIDDISSIVKYNKEIRRDIIKRLIDIKGVSKRQIARILGINYKTIQRIL